MNGLDGDRTGGAVGSSRAGERVTEPPTRELPTATGPVRLARCPFMNGPG